MAIDNLNYYSAWLPAGQQTDRYSSQPWCLRSKNLDIFSSSKSVKATAWSEPTATDADVIKQEWKLVLKTDWKVYERENGVDTLVVDPSANFPVYQVSYNWKNGTYEDAQWGTVQDMSAIYEWDELKSFVVFTDRASYNYSAVKYVLDKKLWLTNLTATHDWDRGSDYGFSWYWFTQSASQNASSITITIDNAPFTSIPLWLFAHQNSNSDTDISIKYIRHRVYKYYYDAQLDWMTPSSVAPNDDIPYTWTLTNWFYVTLPINPVYWNRNVYEISFEYTKKAWASTWKRLWDICIDFNLPNDPSMEANISEWDYNEYYSYLPIRDRKLVSVWDYGYSESFWMKGQTFQPLYKWVSSWIDVNWEKKTIYDFISDMWWENDPWMDVIWIIVWNEQIYMIWNLNGNWYIIPCDLSWGRWTPYIAYGCTFKGATNIDYLLYLVWEDRWISTLWVFNQQELVPVVWWKEEKDSINLIKNEEQYRFDWRIVNWRKNLILTTEDNRIFQYGQTYNGKWWSFINELPWNITSIKTVWNDLVIDYNEPVARTVDTYSWEPPYWDASFNVKVYYNNSTPYSYLFVGHSTTAWAILDRVNTYMWTSYTWLSLSVNWNKLDSNYPLAWTSDDPVVVYVVPDTIDIKKSISYQDDTPVKHYNTEWMAEYPIILWNHLLEKEESDLYCSYILPSAATSLEFWASANHYHFWTFKTDWNTTPPSWSSWVIDGTDPELNYRLEFVEKNWEYLTFKLVWNLPVMTWNETMRLTEYLTLQTPTYISYTEFNHFRKIWEITTTEYKEWEFRFHNLNNKLELPKSHSLQIMVRGKGNQNYTPELFALDLFANQRERW